MPVIVGRGRAQGTTVQTILSAAPFTSGTAATTGVAIGEIVDVVFGCISAASASTFTFSDSVGNTYTSRAQITTLPGPAVAMFSCVVTATIVSGTTTFTATDSGGSFTNGACGIFRVITTQAAKPIISAGSSTASNASSTTASVGSATPTSAPTFGLMAVYTGSTSATGTPPGGGWVEILDIVAGVGGSLQVNQIVKNDKVTIANTETLSVAQPSAGAQWFAQLGLQAHSLHGTATAVSSGATR
jgi:hypothetical protein